MPSDTSRFIGKPPRQPALAAAPANAWLASLLADPQRFRDSTTVGHALSLEAQENAPKSVSTRWRQERRIFGVWDGKTYRYPAFQFDANGRPTSSVEELIAVLPRDDDGSGRDATLWLFAPDAALDGLTPAEMFPTDPSRVITLARIRGSGSDIHD